MPEPTRPCGRVAPSLARVGGREVGSCLEMHKEPLRPASAVWLASREAATRWREGGHGAAHAEGGEERTGAEQTTLEGGMEAEEGGHRGGAVHAGGREATRGQRRREDSRRKTRERKKDQNGTCVTSGRWVIFETKSR